MSVQLKLQLISATLMHVGLMHFVNPPAAIQGKSMASP
jgi:hypothetical protein